MSDSDLSADERPSALLKGKKLFEEVPPSYIQRFLKEFDDFLFDFFPTSQDFPPILRNPMGIVYLICIWILMLVFFINGYNQGRSRVFLAPNESAEGQCTVVPVDITGKFLSSNNGYWEDDPRFSYSKAAYSVTLAGYSVTNSEYEDMVAGIQRQMADLGAVAATKDLAYNALLWMTATLHANPDEISTDHRFTLTGSPMQVLNREFVEGSIANKNVYCDAFLYTLFDTSTARLRFGFDQESLINFERNNCSDVINGFLFGYNYITSPVNYELAFDVKSILIATSVNYGILKLTSLTRIEELSYNRSFEHDGINTEFTIHTFVDPRYPGMDPITCVISLPNPLCVVLVGTVPAIPFFYHVGGSLLEMQQCNCTVLTSDELQDPTHPCHAFNFMTGLLFFNDPEPTPIFEMFLLNNLAFPYESLYPAVFYASSLGKRWAYAGQAPEGGKEAAFSVCDTQSAGGCSILSFSFYDINFRGWTVSPYYYQLVQGACRDSVYMADESWKTLQSRPYAPLVREYKKCRDTMFNVATDQAGIAIGNMQLLLPICVCVIVGVVGLIKKALDTEDPEKYTKNEKADALDALAVAMLLTRDGLLASRGRLSSNGKQAGSDDPGGGAVGVWGEENVVVEGIVRDLQWHIKEVDNRPSLFGLKSQLDKYVSKKDLEDHYVNTYRVKKEAEAKRSENSTYAKVGVDVDGGDVGMVAVSPRLARNSVHPEDV